jgi:hypothetical protein
MSEGQDPPKLSEVDVLFDLFLPMLCEARAEDLERFAGGIEFRLQEDPSRCWSLKGGGRPWVRRGPLGWDGPTLKVSVATALVKALVLGQEPDLGQARGRGELTVEGNPEILAALGLDAAGFERLLTEGLK